MATSPIQSWLIPHVITIYICILCNETIMFEELSLNSNNIWLKISHSCCLIFIQIFPHPINHVLFKLQRVPEILRSRLYSAHRLLHRNRDSGQHRPPILLRHARPTSSYSAEAPGPLVHRLMWLLLRCPQL